MPPLKHTELSHRHIPVRQTIYETDCHKKFTLLTSYCSYMRRSLHFITVTLWHFKSKTSFKLFEMTLEFHETLQNHFPYHITTTEEKISRINYQYLDFVSEWVYITTMTFFMLSEKWTHQIRIQMKSNHFLFPL